MGKEIRLGGNVETGEAVAINAEDRKQGTYMVGITGTGKTTLLLNIVLADIEGGDGLCLLDPHGDLTEDLLVRVPDHRRDDVILFDPADFERPFGLNLFECSDIANPLGVDLVCSQALGTFWKLFYYSWGPQMEDLLRNVSLTLIYNQPEATMAEIPRLLTDREFRASLTRNIPDHAEQVRLFWERTYNPLGERYPHKQLEYSLSTLNKVRRFLLNSVISDIVGQTKSSIDLREIMDEGKILLVKLAKGGIGEENSALLGSIIVGKILLAALSRADILPEERKPFHLIVDEYQNFATSSFSVLQSEARKYNIDTIVAHQYRDQLDEDSQGSTLNVGNLVVFRVSGKDASELAGEFDNAPPPPLITGEHVVRTETGRPWFELKKGAHVNPRVRELARYLTRYMVPLVDDLGDLTRWALMDPLEVREKVAFFEERLDEYLHRRMKGESREQLQGLWRRLWRFGPFCLPRDASVDFDDWIDVRKALQSMDEQEADLVKQLKNAPDGERERIKAELRELPGREARIDLKIRDRIQMQKIYLDRIDELAQFLQKEPVMVASSQAVPIYEKPRPYSDVEGETSNKLANLKAYQARCKLIRGEEIVQPTIKTFPLAEKPVAGRERAEEIRERSRREYGRDRKEVEREIEKRGRLGDSEDEGPVY